MDMDSEPGPGYIQCNQSRFEDHLKEINYYRVSFMSGEIYKQIGTDKEIGIRYIKPKIRYFIK